MIEIIVAGVTLPLPTGFKMTQNIDSTIVNRTDEVSDYTYPVDIPLTDEAIKALGFPISLATATPQKTYDAQLRIDGYSVGSVQVMVQLTSLSKKTISVSILGSYAVLATKVGTTNVNELVLDGDRFAFPYAGAPTPKNFTINGYNFRYITDLDMMTHMKNVVNGTTTADYTFPTCVDYGTNIDGIHTADAVNYINAYDPYITGTFVDPIWHYIRAQFIPNYRDVNVRHWWVPMFYLHYVIRKCFQEKGMNVSGNIFTDPTFTKEILYNTYAINRAGASTSNNPTVITQNSAFISPQNHMPAMPIMEFIQEVCKRYNIDYYYDVLSNTVIFTILKGGALSLTNSMDLTPYAAADPDINFVLDNVDGFSFAFEEDAADTLSTGYDLDTSDNTYGGSVNFPSNLPGILPTSPKELWFVRSLNQYFANNGDWYMFSDNLINFKTSKTGSVTEIKTKALSMPMRVESYYVSSDDGSSYNTLSNMMMPASEIGIAGGPFFRITWVTGGGSSFPWQFDTVTPDKISINPHLVSWYGMRVFRSINILGATINYYYPVASSGTVDMKGNSLSSSSGCWHNPDSTGLYDVYWKTLASAISNSLGIELYVLFDVIAYSRLSINHMYFWYQNLRWLCSKAEINMPFPQLSKLTLIRS